jgi:prepilin-type N-terminal cleavage/methylation domain-containing protein
MKKQSGFTLIELLLVLAIIGIISAIAIPALLGQRARARDKSSITNMTGRVGDLVGQYDKYKEAGLTTGSIVTSLSNYIIATGAADKNPWDANVLAFDTKVDAVTASTQTAMVTQLAAKKAAKGIAHFCIAFPGTGTPGFMGGVVVVDGKVNGSLVVTKATAIE